MYQVSRSQFQKLLEGTKERRLVGAKEFVIEEKVSRVNSLSLVLSGRLLVSQVGIIIVITIIVITIIVIIIIVLIITFVNIIIFVITIIMMYRSVYQSLFLFHD